MSPSYREILPSRPHPRHEARRTEARGRNHPLSTPNTRPSCRQTKNSVPLSCLSPVSNFQLSFPLALTPLESILHCHTLLQRVNPPLLFVSVVHSLIVPFAMCPIIIRPSCPLCFSLSPSDNDHPPFIGQIMGTLLSLYVSAFRFHTKIHYCLPCFSCQASCGRCDQG
jgi:hypothetical protein